MGAPASGKSGAWDFDLSKNDYHEIMPSDIPKVAKRAGVQVPEGLVLIGRENARENPPDDDQR